MYNTTPKRLGKGTAEKRRHDLRKHALKVPCRCTKQCVIRIPQLQRIRIWTEFWNLKDYDTRRAFMYQLIERKPVQRNNEQRAKNFKEQGRPCLLSDLRVIEFRRGYTVMFVKKRHNDTEFIKFDFLKKNHKVTTDSHAPLREEPRGIPPEKKSEMITKLLPLIPTTRLW